MIKRYKENKATYVYTCKNCDSKFTYQYTDVDNWNCIRCPYCNDNNKANFRRFWLKPRKYEKIIDNKEKYERIINIKNKTIEDKDNEILQIKDSHKAELKYEKESKDRLRLELSAVEKENKKLSHLKDDIKSKIIPVLRDIENRKGVISKKMVVDKLNELLKYVEEQ